MLLTVVASGRLAWWTQTGAQGQGAPGLCCRHCTLVAQARGHLSSQESAPLRPAVSPSPLRPTCLLISRPPLPPRH